MGLTLERAKELEHDVRLQATALNKALLAAQEAGLMVDIDVYRVEVINQPEAVSIGALVVVNPQVLE